MRTSLVIGQDKAISEWVEKQLNLNDLSPCVAIGIAAGDRIICGVVYNNFYTDANDAPLAIEMTIASIDKLWCSRYNLKTFFAYPFIQLNVKRVQATCSADNRGIRAFLLRLGFHFEGIGRQAHPHGGDSAVYSMLQHECRWL